MILSLVLLPFVLLLIILMTPIYFFLDKGAVVYVSYRLGKNGVPFRMYKFRTMIVDAPDFRLEDGSTYNSDDDPRLTKIGRFLRKTSIDELPQIINVLIGDMSFIGPRPDTLDSLEKYTDKQRIILNVKPGISGYSQAYFRNSVDSNTKLKNDVYYANNISFLLDFKILLKTLRTVLLRENLYVKRSTE